MVRTVLRGPCDIRAVSVILDEAAACCQQEGLDGAENGNVGGNFVFVEASNEPGYLIDEKRRNPTTYGRNLKGTGSVR